MKELKIKKKKKSNIQKWQSQTSALGVLKFLSHTWKNQSIASKKLAVSKFGKF